MYILFSEIQSKKKLQIREKKRPFKSWRTTKLKNELREVVIGEWQQQNKKETKQSTKANASIDSPVPPFRQLTSLACQHQTHCASPLPSSPSTHSSSVAATCPPSPTSGTSVSASSASHQWSESSPRWSPPSAGQNSSLLS